MNGARLVQQLFVKEFLARQCAVVGGKRLVLERLQFRRDVALDVLQRLAAAVVVGHLVRVGEAHLDVEAVHAVVFHFELVDAGARAFAQFQLHQEIAAVGLDAAQFVQFGVETVGDHAAFAKDGGRLGFHRHLQQLDQRVVGDQDIG